MFQEDRLRRLGDRRGDNGSTTGRSTAGPIWSANTPLRAADRRRLRRADGHARSASTRRCTVHALLLLYDARRGRRPRPGREHVEAALAPHEVDGRAHACRSSLRLDDNGISREHFGFADGLSQPVPFDGGRGRYGDGTSVPQAIAWHGVPLGEILIGYINGHHEIAPGPVVGRTTAKRPARAAGSRRIRRPRASSISGSTAATWWCASCRQDVAAFWHSMDASAEADPRRAIREHSGHVTADWLAERVVGRNTRRPPALPRRPARRPTSTASRDNDFGFLDNDPHGIGCPLGSHVRRANPRDASRQGRGTAQTLLDAANNHRILRRGRKFGPTIADPPQGRRRGSRPALHLPQHRHRPPVRVRPADLAAQPEFRDALSTRSIRWSAPRGR